MLMREIILHSPLSPTNTLKQKLSVVLEAVFYLLFGSVHRFKDSSAMET